MNVHRLAWLLPLLLVACCGCSPDYSTWSLQDVQREIGLKYLQVTKARVTELTGSPDVAATATGASEVIAKFGEVGPVDPNSRLNAYEGIREMCLRSDRKMVGSLDECEVWLYGVANPKISHMSECCHFLVFSREIARGYRCGVVVFDKSGAAICAYDFWAHVRQTGK